VDRYYGSYYVDYPAASNAILALAGTSNTGLNAAGSDRPMQSQQRLGNLSKGESSRALAPRRTELWSEGISLKSEYLSAV
jgi:hypothetical protein